MDNQDFVWPDEQREQVAQGVEIALKMFNAIDQLEVGGTLPMMIADKSYIVMRAQDGTLQMPSGATPAPRNWN